MPTITALARPTQQDTDTRAVIATDAAGVIRHLTPAAEQVLGYGADDLVGQSLSSLHVADELRARAAEVGLVGNDEVEAVFTTVRSGMVPFERQRWTYLCGDSARIRVNTTVTAVRGGPDDVVSFVILLETPQVVTGPAASADRRAPLVPVGDDYASSVSHELRTPIAIILGYTEILHSLDAGPLTDPQRAMLGKIERNANRVLEMMQSVLRRFPDAADSEAPAGPEPVDLVEVVERSVDKIDSRLHDKQLRLTVDLGASPAVVSGSAQHLSVMVDNLLCNAVRFTPNGGTMSVTLTADQGESVLVVADSGCGIPPEEQSQVFTRFFRSQAQQASPGQGLGLSTAQAIASMHGGRIDVESCVGEGTDFVVRIPTTSSPDSSYAPRSR